MRSTARLSDELLALAQSECARQWRTLTSLIAEGVILALAPGAARRERVT